MKYKFIIFFMFSCLFFGYACAELPSLEPIKINDRVLILAPHPDDESIACAGVIQDAKAIGAAVRVVYLTSGDHNEPAFIVYEKRLTFRKGEFIHMGYVRMREAFKAVSFLEIGPSNVTFLGYPDFGTFAMFRQYWQVKKPFRDLMTRISSVPYRGAVSYGAPYIAENILADLEKVLRDYKPNKIFVSHPADTNPDHKALYLFLRIALEGLHNELPEVKIYPYLVHCSGWPIPRGYHPELGIAPPYKLSNSGMRWLSLKLSSQQIQKKYQAILTHKSQTNSSASYLLAFCRQNELFGNYPDILLKKQGPSSRAVVQNSFGFGVNANFFLIRVRKEKEINKKIGFMCYIFSYSSKLPFAQMPKLRIVTRNNKVKVFNGRKLIKQSRVFVGFEDGSVTLRIPLKLLGDPDFVLTSLKIYGRALPLETIGFRGVRIK